MRAGSGAVTGGTVTVLKLARLRRNALARGCDADAVASSTGANDTLLVAKTALDGEKRAKAKSLEFSVTRRGGMLHTYLQNTYNMGTYR